MYKGRAVLQHFKWPSGYTSGLSFAQVYWFVSREKLCDVLTKIRKGEYKPGLSIIIYLTGAKVNDDDYVWRDTHSEFQPTQQ